MEKKRYTIGYAKAQIRYWRKLLDELQKQEKEKLLNKLKTLNVSMPDTDTNISDTNISDTNISDTNISVCKEREQEEREKVPPHPFKERKEEKEKESARNIRVRARERLSFRRRIVHLVPLFHQELRRKVRPLVSILPYITPLQFWQ